MGPGPPPLGSWAASPGGPWGGGPGPMSASQKWLSPLVFGIIFYIDFDVDFWSSRGRFGLRLGGHFRSFWRLGRPKLVPRPSLNRFIFEKVNFHETSAGVMSGAFPGPQESTQNDPRSTQDGSKIVLDRVFRFFIFRFDFESFSVSFWCRFGLPNGAPGVRANLWSGPWRQSKTVLGSSWIGSLVVLSFGIAFLVVLGSFWARFWALRGSFWCSFGISTHRFNPSTHQLVDSTHQLINPSIQLINPAPNNKRWNF